MRSWQHTKRLCTTSVAIVHRVGIILDLDALQVELTLRDVHDGVVRIPLSVSDAGREPLAGGGVPEAVEVPRIPVSVEAPTLDRAGRRDPIASVEWKAHETIRDRELEALDDLCDLTALEFLNFCGKQSDAFNREFPESMNWQSRYFCTPSKTSVLDTCPSCAHEVHTSGNVKHLKILQTEDFRNA